LLAAAALAVQVLELAAAVQVLEVLEQQRLVCFLVLHTPLPLVAAVLEERTIRSQHLELIQVSTVWFPLEVEGVVTVAELQTAAAVAQMAVTVVAVAQVRMLVAVRWVRRV